MERLVPGFGTLLFENIVAGLFGAGEGRGPLRVETLNPDDPAPVIVARTLVEETSGNFGSGLPADIEPAAGVVSIPGLFHGDEYRSSVSVTADTEQGLWASFELFRGDGGLVGGGVQRRVAAGAQDQWSLDRLFPELVQDGVPMTVRVTLPRRGIAFGSLVDNASTDSAIYLGMTPATEWIVPVVAHLPGKDETFWSSTVSVWNAGRSATTVQLEYLPDRTDNSAGGIDAAPFLLGGYETRSLDDVLETKFGITDGKGVLVVKATNEITVTSRVWTAAPEGGTSGNGVRTIHSSALVDGEVVLPGVRMLNGFRTNVGVGTGNSWATVDFRLRDADGILLAQEVLEVPPRTLRHLSINKLFDNNVTPPDPVGSLVVTSGTEFFAYLTVIDGTSQDPLFVMSR